MCLQTSTKILPKLHSMQAIAEYLSQSGARVVVTDHPSNQEQRWTIASWCISGFGLFSSKLLGKFLVWALTCEMLPSPVEGRLGPDFCV